MERLKLAIKCKQKSFVAHPNVQQLLSSIWYEGVPGFRRKNIFFQSFTIFRLCLMYPFYCIAYMIAPDSEWGEVIKNPFIKFICHSSSYIVFLMLLSLASQRIEYLIVELVGTLLDDDDLFDLVKEWEKKERGSLPSIVETVIILWQVGERSTKFKMSLKTSGIDFLYLQGVFCSSLFSVYTKTKNLLSKRGAILHCKFLEK